MPIWVLFIFMMPPNANSGGAIATQEFTSKKACEEARGKIGDLVINNSMIPWKPQIVSFCTPKDEGAQ